MSVGIDELMDMLSWKSDEETQRKGIELAKDVKCFSVFIRPYGFEHGKDVWENSAKILASYPDETLETSSLELLQWLTDMNLPGAEIIFQRLINFKKTDFLCVILGLCVKEALARDDDAWLCNMAALLKNENINEDNLPKDIYNSLHRRYMEMIY